jgi:hypothetical protein
MFELGMYSVLSSTFSIIVATGMALPDGESLALVRVGTEQCQECTGHVSLSVTGSAVVPTAVAPPDGEFRAVVRVGSEHLSWCVSYYRFSGNFCYC